MKTTWVTFYSYKGGVGRTMALANVAGRLATWGRRVVMIDFDLEAPGLDSFKEFSDGRKPGVVEYIHQFVEDRKTPPISRFVHPCPATVAMRGKLWLMPSGRKDDKYASRLHAINWSELYREHVAQPFIANWKAAIEKTFEPDYVLIDSRTGLTDVGGVCTLHFPDIDVLFFALNSQNIEGTAAVLRTISKASEARPIDVLTVASPIPNLTKDSSTLGTRMNKAESELGGPITATIGYFAPIALEERVWSLDDSSVPASILAAYDILSRKITQRVRDGVDFYLSRGEEILKTGAIDDAPAIADSLLKQYGDRLEALKTAAKIFRILGERKKASEVALKILNEDSTDLDSFNWVVSHIRTQPALLKDFLQHHVLLIVPSLNFAKGEVLMEAGHVYMQLHEFHAAATSYVRAAQCFPPGDSIANRFNFLEAKRRSTGSVLASDLSKWARLAVDAEKMLDNILRLQSDRTTNATTSANTFQALSGVYAIIGEPARARELLVRAELVARTLNPTTRIFSVVDYDHVEREKFLARNSEMLQALERGELWDGMKLPPASTELSLNV